MLAAVTHSKGNTVNKYREFSERLKEEAASVAREGMIALSMCELVPPTTHEDFERLHLLQGRVKAFKRMSEIALELGLDNEEDEEGGK